MNRLSTRKLHGSCHDTLDLGASGRDITLPDPEVFQTLSKLHGIERQTVDREEGELLKKGGGLRC